jgi:hypothetical protein
MSKMMGMVQGMMGTLTKDNPQMGAMFESMMSNLPGMMAGMPGMPGATPPQPASSDAATGDVPALPAPENK